jgi:hypothetical protein
LQLSIKLNHRDRSNLIAYFFDNAHYIGENLDRILDYYSQIISE